MKTKNKLILFILIMLSGVVSIALLLGAIELTPGWGVVGAVGVGYLVVQSAYLLFKKWH